LIKDFENFVSRSGTCQRNKTKEKKAEDKILLLALIKIKKLKESVVWNLI
jgi:hypothetical protein